MSIFKRGPLDFLTAPADRLAVAPAVARPAEQAGVGPGSASARFSVRMRTGAWSAQFAAGVPPQIVDGVRGANMIALGERSHFDAIEIWPDGQRARAVMLTADRPMFAPRGFDFDRVRLVLPRQTQDTSTPGPFSDGSWSSFTSGNPRTAYPDNVVLPFDSTEIDVYRGEIHPSLIGGRADLVASWGEDGGVMPTDGDYYLPCHGRRRLAVNCRINAGTFDWSLYAILPSGDTGTAIASGTGDGDFAWAYEGAPYDHLYLTLNHAAATQGFKLTMFAGDR